MLPRISKNGEEITKTISHKLKSIDSAKSMARALSNLVSNLGDIIHKIKCKCRPDNKKCKTCGSKYKNFECYLKCRNIKDDLIVWKCLYCNGDHQKKQKQNRNLVIHTPFLTMIWINLFCCFKKLFTQWIHGWLAKSFPGNKDFYSHLNIEDITDAGYTHADRKSLKKIWNKKN